MVKTALQRNGTSTVLRGNKCFKSDQPRQNHSAIGQRGEANIIHPWSKELEGTEHNHETLNIAALALE